MSSVKGLGCSCSLAKCRAKVHLIYLPFDSLKQTSHKGLRLGLSYQVDCSCHFLNVKSGDLSLLKKSSTCKLFLLSTGSTTSLISIPQENSPGAHLTFRHEDF